MSYRQIIHKESGRVLCRQARWCDSSLSRLRGFAFRRHLAVDDGLVLVQQEESRVNAGVTMFFTFFDLAVIWVNDAGLVVDKRLARSWRPSYLPQAPARYAIELHPDQIDVVEIGQHIEFVST